MKKSLAMLVCASVLVSVSAWAVEPTGDASHPCKALEDACKSAGFVKGGAKTGKGLWKNCMEPLMSGQAVTGVSADSATVQACKAKKAAHEASEQHK